MPTSFTTVLKTSYWKASFKGVCVVACLSLGFLGCISSDIPPEEIDGGATLMPEEAAITATPSLANVTPAAPLAQSGQAAQPNPEQPKPVGTEIPASGRVLAEPILQMGYRLRIAVMVGDTQELAPTEVLVSDKCEITLPLVGKIDCNGLTLNGLRSRLTTRYGEFMRDPEVTVSFVYSEDSLSPYGQVLVQGRVAREGWVNIPMTRVLKLSRAIQLSGGFASSARKSSVRVTRRDAEGKPVHYKVDVEAIGKYGDLDKDIVLEPDDVIYVYESNF